MRKWSFLKGGGAALAVLLLGATAALAAEKTPREGTFHHRALWMENPQSEIVLSWSTAHPGRNHRVYWDTESRGGDTGSYANQQKTFKSGPFTIVEKDAGWSDPAHFHHVHLSGLEADTTYYVVFASDDATSREFHFVTATGTDREFAMLFGGDSRIGTADPYVHTDRQKMNDRMRVLFEDESEGIIGLIHGGDYCMTAEWRHIEPWLTDHELTTTASGRLLPVVPARGNHDRAIGFEEMFPWPNLQTNYYYETPLSPEVSLVTLNTEISIAGDQRDWLAGTLARVRPENRWVLVSYHRPAFSSVRDVQDGAGRRNNWVPYFEEFNVDLVMESHDHALKRTLPIRSSAPDSKKGVVYIGDGGLGVPQRTPDPTRWWLQEPGMTKAVHHVHVLRFNEEKIHGRAIGMHGDIEDEFTLAPREVPVEVGGGG